MAAATTSPVTDYRQEWFEIEDAVYLNAASQAPMPKVSHRAVQAALEWKKNPHHMPDSANFEVCRLNLEPYGNRQTLIRGAIWKSEGRLAMQAGNQEWVHRVVDDQSGNVVALTMPSLIARCNGKVDLLKLDIEGSELDVFGEDAQEWLPGIRNIAIELHGDDRKDRFFTALADFDFDLSLHCSWMDPSSTSGSCYLALCQNLRLKPAVTPK